MKILDFFAVGLATDKEGLRFWEFLAICGYIVGLLGIGAYAFAEGPFFTIFGVLMLVGAAAWLSGGVLGFVFGVPRLRGGSMQNLASSPVNNFVPNTNLEQISDWLTKIIVGATLVQLGPLVEGINKLSIAIGNSLGTKGASFASGAVIVIYFAAGFMWGYLWCSLRIFKEMSALTDREEAVSEREASSGAGRRP